MSHESFKLLLCHTNDSFYTEEKRNRAATPEEIQDLCKVIQRLARSTGRSRISPFVDQIAALKDDSDERQTQPKPETDAQSFCQKKRYHTSKEIREFCRPSDMPIRIGRRLALSGGILSGNGSTIACFKTRAYQPHRNIGLGLIEFSAHREYGFYVLCL